MQRTITTREISPEQVSAEGTRLRSTKILCPICRKREFRVAAGTKRHTCSRECQIERTRRLHLMLAESSRPITPDEYAGTNEQTRTEYQSYRGETETKIPKYSDKDITILELLMTNEYTYNSIAKIIGCSREAIRQRAAALYFLPAIRLCSLCDSRYQPTRLDQNYCARCAAFDPESRSRFLLEIATVLQQMAPRTNRCAACHLYKNRGGPTSGGYCRSCTSLSLAESRKSGTASAAKRTRRNQNDETNAALNTARTIPPSRIASIANSLRSVDRQVA